MMSDDTKGWQVKTNGHTGSLNAMVTDGTCPDTRVQCTVQSSAAQCPMINSQLVSLSRRIFDGVTDFS